MKTKAPFFILGTLLLEACMHGQNIELEGTIKYVGATPHHYLALEDSKQHLFKISNPQAFKLEKLQNHRVKAKVAIIKKAVGPGFPPIIKILDIQEKE